MLLSKMRQLLSVLSKSEKKSNFRFLSFSFPNLLVTFHVYQVTAGKLVGFI